MKLQRLYGALGAALMLFAAPAGATEQATYVLPIAGPMSMATFVGSSLNPALRGLASCSWGPSAPANGPGAAALPYQLWCDTTTNPIVVKINDGTSWVVVGKLNNSSHGWTPSYQGTDLGNASTATTGTSGHVLGFLDGAGNVINGASLTLGGCTMPGGAIICAAGNITSTTGFVGAQYFGGVATNSSVTLSSTTNASPSGDVANVSGSTVNIGANTNRPTTVNLGYSAGGGVTVNIGNASNGVNAFNVFNSVGGKQVWIAGPGTGTTPGTLQFPAGTRQMVATDTTDTLSNKTITAPTINSGALSGTFSGSPAFSGVNFLTLANLAQSSGGAQFLGVSGASAANYSPFTLASLTPLASPSATLDLIPCVDHVSGTIKSCTPSAISSSVGSGVTSLNGQAGSLVSYYAPEGRLTLTSGTPVMQTSQAAQTVVYYTPYAGNMVPMYDGTNMVPVAVPEIFQATTNTTQSPAAVAANSCYDNFVWNPSSPELSRGPAWTNATTRSAGTVLVRVNGIYLNSVSITNGPAAQRGTYVGTVCSNGSSTIDFIFGAAASGGTAAVLNVWNAYNRINFATTVTDNGASYTYSSGTARQARASAGNQISFVVGLSEESVSLSYAAKVSLVPVAGAAANIAFGLDNIITGTAVNVIGNPSTGTFAVSLNAVGFWPASQIGIGQHFIAALEGSDGTNLNTLNSSIGGTGRNTLGAMLRM